MCSSDLEQRRHRAILLTTHSMEEAEICDRIGILANGSLQTVGSSLFLKRTFGAGYTLTVVKAPEVTLTETAARGKKAVAAAAAALAALEPTAAELSVENLTRVRLTPSGRRIARALSSVMPSIVPLSDIGGEMTFAVPTKAASHLSTFLESLECTKEVLGVESFAVSTTPLSDVFFTVANASVVDEDAPNAVVSIPTVQIKTNDFVADKSNRTSKINRDNTCVPSETVNVSDMDPSLNASSLTAKDIRTASFTESSNERIKARLRAAGSGKVDAGADINGFYQSDKDLWQDDFAGRRLYGKSLSCSIFRALYCKRALVARRDFGSTFSQTIVPIIVLIAVFVAIMLAAVPISSSRSRVEFSLQKSYGSKEVLPELPRFVMPLFTNTTDDGDMLRNDFVRFSDLNVDAMMPTSGAMDASRCNLTDAYDDMFHDMFATDTEFHIAFGVGQFCQARNIYPNVTTSTIRHSNCSIGTPFVATDGDFATSVIHSMLLINTSVALSLPIATTGITNALLAGAHSRQSAALPEGSAKPPLAQLTASHNILGITARWISIDVFKEYVYVANIVTGIMMILASTFGHVIVIERVNFSKQLQLVSGASAWSYWLAHAMWDITVSLFVAVPCIVILCLLSMPSYTIALYMVASFMLMIMSSIALAYCVALFAQTPSKCQIYLYGIHGLSIFTSIGFFMALLSIAEDTDTFSKVMLYVNSVFYVINICIFPMASFAIFNSVFVSSAPASDSVIQVLLLGGAVSVLLYTGLLILFEKRTRQVRKLL